MVVAAGVSRADARGRGVARGDAPRIQPGHRDDRRCRSGRHRGGDRGGQARGHRGVDHRGSSGGDTGCEIRRTVGGHMRRIVMVLAMIFGAAPLAAQEPQCNSPPTPFAAACNTAVDAVRAFYPLAGMIVAGGNPVLGTSGSLGGLGHFTLTARVNGIKAALPDPSAATQSPVPTSFNGVIPAPVVEGAVGLLQGVGGGLLAVDVLGSALILPTGVDHLTVESNAHFAGAAVGVGYGVRVGVLNGSFPVPAVSVSWMHRTLPRLRYGTLGPFIGSGDEFEFTMDLSSD